MNRKRIYAALESGYDGYISEYAIDGDTDSVIDVIETLIREAVIDSEATVERVSALPAKWDGAPGNYSVELVDGLQGAARELRAALADPKGE